MHLTTDQMVTVAEVFQGAYQHVMGNFLPGQTKTEIEKFVADIILREKPYMLVTEEGIQHAMQLVFTREVIRDFVFTLSFIFFARWGEYELDLMHLAANLANGISQVPSPAGLVGRNPEALCAVPKDIAARLANNSDITELLAVNKWLVILLLLQLFVVIQAPPGSETKNK